MDLLEPVLTKYDEEVTLKVIKRIVVVGEHESHALFGRHAELARSHLREHVDLMCIPSLYLAR